MQHILSFNYFFRSGNQNTLHNISPKFSPIFSTITALNSIDRELKIERNPETALVYEWRN